MSARAAMLAEVEGGWRPLFAPSPIPFSSASPTPEMLDEKGIARVVQAFADAALRAREAGAKVVGDSLGARLSAA